MKTLDQLQAFCEGYLAAASSDDLSNWDDWVTWGGYEIQFNGQDLDRLATNAYSLACDVYFAGFEDLSSAQLLHRFAVQKYQIPCKP